MNEIKLGLCNPPFPIYLYVDKVEAEDGIHGWYNYDVKQGLKTPISQKALIGYISELRLTDKEFKGKDTMKLDIVVLADELYIIRSGIETNFSKSFLSAASLVEDFSKPLIIVANPGDENVVFCNLYDAETKAKIRHDSNLKPDFAKIIQDIQAKLSCNGTRSYGLEEEFTAAVKQPITQSKTAAIHPQDLRVKTVRTLLNYPVDLVKEWLQFQSVKVPSQLEKSKVDELVKTMCMAWAADKVEHPNHAASSYQQQVVNAVGMDEIAAIQGWINYVLGQRVTVSSSSRKKAFTPPASDWDDPNFNDPPGHADNYGDS
jgi:hypothetical protein